MKISAACRFVIVQWTLLAFCILLTASLRAQDAEAEVTVHLQNAAGVSDEALGATLSGGERILKLAGVSSIWCDMEGRRSLGQFVAVGSSSPARRLILRLLVSRHGISADPQAMGEALIVDGSGTYANVYVDRVRAFAEKHRLPFGMALAHAAAHEVGHLIQGNTMHSRDGLMRAHWGKADADEMRGGAMEAHEQTVAAFRKSLGAVAGSLVAVHKVSGQSHDQ